MEAPHRTRIVEEQNLLFLIAHRLHLFGALLLFSLALLIAYDVGARAFFNAPFAPTTELARNGVVIIAFLQLPYTIASRTLLNVVFLRQKVGPKLRLALELLGYAVGLAIFGILAAYSIPEMLEAFHKGAYEGSEAFRMPIGPVRLIAIALWGFSSLVLIQLMREAISRQGAAE